MFLTAEVTGGNKIAILANGGISATFAAAAEAAADIIADEVAGFDDFKYHTSQYDDRDDIKFSESIRIEDTIDAAGRIGVSVISNSAHAVFIEKGTQGGYYIYPKNGKVLVFDNRDFYEIEHPKKGGKISTSGKVAVKSVFHPGIQDPPAPFRKTLDANQDRIRAIFANVLAPFAGGVVPGGRASGVFKSGGSKGQTFFKDVLGRFAKFKF